MKEKFELAGVLAFLGTVLGGFAAFLGWSGIPADLAANYGAAVKDLFWVVTMGALFVACLRFLICYERLSGGEAPPGSGPREKYDALRASLAVQTSQEDAYARRLGAVLDRVDRFFGDAGAPGQTAFLLVKPAALWTVSSYDGCLLLALIYPFSAIFLIWTVSGEVGPAEQALGLTLAKSMQRWLAVAAMAAAAFLLWLYLERIIRRKLAFFIIVPAVGAAGVAFASTNGVITAFSASLVVVGVLAAVASARQRAGAAAGALCVAGALATAGGAPGSAVALSITQFTGGNLALALALSGFFSGAVAVVVLSATKYFASKSRPLYFLAGFIGVMLAACFAMSRYLSQLREWQDCSPLLLFLGLLTLVNAPFDWASLGMTRLLLRYGIERGGPWPYALALIDAVLASALIALLAVAMVAGVDLFDHLAEIGGGEKARVLPPMQFYLSALRTQPQAPEFWWIYATLFSTMLPSVINLFIAGFSFLRGLPVLRDFLLGVMRENETMPAAHRFAAALILTLQGSIAVLFALSAQALLAWGVLWHLMPMLGLGVLDLAEKVAM